MQETSMTAIAFASSNFKIWDALKKKKNLKSIWWRRCMFMLLSFISHDLLYMLYFMLRIESRRRKVEEISRKKWRCRREEENEAKNRIGLLWCLFKTCHHFWLDRNLKIPARSPLSVSCIIFFTQNTITYWKTKPCV